MRIDLRDQHRRRQFSTEVDLQNPPAVVKPPQGDGAEVYLQWDQAIDDQGHLRHCPACGCRELFARKDFPQIVGLLIVIVAAVVAMAMLYAGFMVAAMSVLAGTALADGIIFFIADRCLVCYRCRSEFRDLPIHRDHPPWDLATGEKYRPTAAAPDTAAQKPQP